MRETMLEQFQIGSKILQVDSQSKHLELRKSLHPLLLHIDEWQRPPDASIEVVEHQSLVLPEFAVRVHNNDRRGAQEYVLGDEKFFIRRTHSILINYSQHKLCFFAHSALADVRDEFEHCVRWSIAALAQAQHLTYVPGHGISDGQFCSILTGDPECGRTELLTLLHQSSRYNLVPNLACRSQLDAPTTCVSFPSTFAPAAKQPELAHLRDLFQTEAARSAPVPFFREVGTLRAICLVNKVCQIESEYHPITADEGIAALRRLSSRAFEYLSEDQIFERLANYARFSNTIRWLQFNLGEEETLAFECISSALSSGN